MTAQVVEVSPSDLDRIPWTPACGRCSALAADPHPGLVTWVGAVGAHLLHDHQVALVFPGAAR